MTKARYTGIEVVPTTREQVTKINSTTNKLEFDRGQFRQNAEMNRDRYIKSVESRRRQITVRERD